MIVDNSLTMESAGGVLVFMCDNDGIGDAAGAYCVAMFMQQIENLDLKLTAKLANIHYANLRAQPVQPWTQQEPEPSSAPSINK